MKEPILRVENLIKYVGNGFTLDISRLEFQSGKIYSLVGPNGAGKTTLLNLLNLLEEPDNGKIFFNGKKIVNSLDIRRKMSMVMENPLLFHTTVSKNIISGLKFHSCPTDGRRAIDKKMWHEVAEESLKIVGLEGFGKRYAPDLSRGETQRVAIARALVFKPEVLFLDEPFTNIDKKNITIIEELIKIINEKNSTTIIFSTHDFSQAYRLSDEVISLLDGKVVKGSIENLFSGEIEEVNGSKFVKILPSVKIAVVTEKKGKIHISIAPQDIILSHNQLESSARNSFKGIIKRIQMEDQVVRIFVDIRLELVALITATSYSKMGLSVGSSVFLTFKTTSVMTF